MFKLFMLVVLSANLFGESLTTTWYKPSANTTWQWQLDGSLNIKYDVEIYDVDLFDTSKKTIRSLKKDGKKVICYFSAGSYEDWRDDADMFSDKMKAKKMDGWDERWLDIRDESLKLIMIKRIQLAYKKGCDGIEADNIDAYANETGLSLSSNEQLQYNKFLAKEAHKRGLAIGLKNDLDQIDDLISYFDFAVNEQCHEYNECDKLRPFILANKAVLNAEYAGKYKNNIKALCQESKKNRFSTLVLPIDLDDSFRYSCD